MSTRPSLNALGVMHGTDKSSLYHDYLPLYESFLAPIRYTPVRVLEIGVGGGASLRMWADYFEDPTIIGLDVDEGARQHEGDKVRIEIADQSNETALEDIAAR